MKILFGKVLRYTILCMVTMSTPSFAVEFTLYGDYTFNKSFGDSSANQFNDTQKFQLGGLNLTTETELSDTSDIVAELLFEYAEHGYQANVTRFAITKRLTPTTEVYVGKFVKGLGLWHQTFHYGSLALDTISLPFFVGGPGQHHSFVAAHVVGIGTSSKFGNFSYQVALANHPGINSKDSANAIDGRLKLIQVDRESPANNFSTVLKLNYAFNWKSEISLFGHRRDVVELDPTGGSPQNSGLDVGEAMFKQEQIGLNFLYAGERFSSFVEYYELRTTDNPSLTNPTLIPASPILAKQDSYEATFFYYQIGWKFTDLISSSIRYEGLVYSAENTFFQILGVEKQTRNILGINYRFDDSNAIRFEYKQIEYDIQFSSKPNETIYALQWFFLLL